MRKEVLMSDNMRSHFRIVYSIGVQPILECPQGKFNVLDISEGGVRFIMANEKTPRFAENDRIEGKIVFPEKRGFVKISGRVLRINLREVAVTLEEGGTIPLAKIMEEQRALIQKGRLLKPSR